MNDSGKSFHEIALKSVLFKGQSDMYFCFLKLEKIAYVLTVLATQTAIKDSEKMEELVSTATHLPHAMLHFVAGEVDAGVLLADLFSALSFVHMGSTQGYLSKQNAQILAQEYELVVRKITAQSHPSPFVSSEDFAVQEVAMPPQQSPLLESPQGVHSVKDIYKRHKGHSSSKRQTMSENVSDRMSLILDFVRKNKEVSIKDISGAVRGCSEKTIQRELAQLIGQGLVERRGERRWSVYRALPSSSQDSR